jgi:hypothetical protein
MPGRADFLVADAVPRNQSPLGEFPACREKSREFLDFGLIWLKLVPQTGVFSGGYGRNSLRI